jgi:Fe-S oxidoreductase
MEIQVMEYIAHAIRGETETVATLSFQCIMCGACASKCPAEISQPNVALLARRIFGRHMLVIPNNVYQRISDIEKGKYTRVLEQLVQMDQEQLTHTYTLREQEPQDNRGWTPKHPTFPEDPPADR